MRIVVPLLLCLLTLAALAAPTALQLPTGDRYVPVSVLTGLGVVRKGDVAFTLTRGKLSESFILDSLVRDDLPVPFVMNGETYIPDGALDTLEIERTVTKTGLVLAVKQGKKTVKSITCPLRTLPLAPNASGCYPIVDFERCSLIGGVRKNAWCEADDIVKYMTGKEQFKLYTPTACVGTVKTNGKPTYPDEGGGGLFYYHLSNVPNDLGLCVPWNPLPRVPKAESLTSPVYLQEAAKLAAAHGIVKPAVALTQLFRVDLDGDGKDEVIMNAKNADDDRLGEAGDFNLIAIRKLTDGQLVTHIPLAYFTPHEGGVTRTLSIVALLDVDNDGRQELITRLTDPWPTVTVYKYAEGRFWPTLSYSWGD